MILISLAIRTINRTRLKLDSDLKLKNGYKENSSLKFCQLYAKAMEATSTVIIVNENKKRDNILKDYQALFRPFTIVQNVFMLSKYKLKNNTVQPNSTFYNVLSIVYSLALLICHHFSTFRPFYANKCKGSLLERYVCVMQESPVLWLGIFINVCTNIVQRQNNVLFVLKIQNVCAFLRNSGSNIDKFTIFNWCNVIFDIGFQISWILIFNYAFTSTMHTYELLGNVIYVIFDTNIIYTITLMRFLLMAFRSWIDESKKWHLETNFNNRVYWNKMFGDYVDIYEAYEIVAKVFNPLVRVLFNLKLDRHLTMIPPDGK